MKRVLFLILIVVAGCDTRTDFFAFDCTVYDQRLDQPVADATVRMYVQPAGNGFTTNYELAGAVNTDATGKFYLEIDKDVFQSYRVDVTHPNHFSKSYFISPDDVPFSSAYEQTFVVEPRAWFATRLVNQNFSSSATFSVEADNGNCAECCSGDNTTVQGFSVDSTFVCPVFGEQEVTVSGNYVDMNATVIQILETAYVQAFDTTTVTVIY